MAYGAHPFLTDDTGTQGKGNWQLELQGDFLRDTRTADAGAGPVERRDKADISTNVLSYGITETLDIQFGVAYLRASTSENGVVLGETSGMADSTLELKWRFYESGKFSLGLKPTLILPTGDETKGRGTGKLSYGIALLSTLEAEPWTFLANVAYTRLNYELAQDAQDGRSNLWRVSAGAWYALNDQLRLVGEGGLRSNESRNDVFLPDSNSQFAMLGVIYSPTKKMDFDAGFRKVFNRAESDKAFLVGATFRW